MTGGFVAFADEWGRERLAPFADHCAMWVVDPNRNPRPDFAVPHPRKTDLGDFLSRLKALRPQLGVICSYSKILPPELIHAFPLGVVNLHPGRLPDYRGANVLQWAIINGETETAASLLYVGEGIDDGPVIDALTVPIASESDALTVRGGIAAAADELLSLWLPRLLHNRVPARPQNESDARTWPRRKPADGAIDWSQSDRRIHDLIRALAAPWPGAFCTTRDGEKLILDKRIDLELVAALRKRCAP